MTPTAASKTPCSSGRTIFTLLRYTDTLFQANPAESRRTPTSPNPTTNTPLRCWRMRPCCTIVPLVRLPGSAGSPVRVPMLIDPGKSRFRAVAPFV